MTRRPLRAGWARLIGLAAVGLLAASCGGEARGKLTAVDVTGIPDGNATGTGFSGIYVITAGKIEACACSRPDDFCSTGHVNIGRAFTVTQTNGRMTAVFSTLPDVTYAGAVNADGSYRLGVALEKPGDLEYLSMYGHIRVDGAGHPTSMDTTQEAFVDTTAFACDEVKASFSSDYQAPLPP